MQLKFSTNFVQFCLDQTPLGVGPTTALFFGVKLFQEKILYIPKIDELKKSKDNPPLFKSPNYRNLPFDNISIKHDSLELKGWFIKQLNFQTSPTLIFFHENAGNLGHRLEYFQKYYEQLKCNIVCVAYRGYDESQGQPNQVGIQKDAIAIVRYVFSSLDIDKNNVFIHGRSLGGAVAIYAANALQDSKKERIKAIIIENTFTSIEDVVSDLVPSLPIAKQLFSRNLWKSSETIKNIALPILFISSGQDELVPCKQMFKLFELAEKAKYKQNYHIPNGDHNSNWVSDEQNYFQEISKFLQSIQQ